MERSVRVSLANKCQLLFGAAVVLILVAALTVVSLRMSALVERQPRTRAQDLARAWLDDRIQLGGAIVPVEASLEPPAPEQDLTLSLIGFEQFDEVTAEDPFLAEAIVKFRTSDRSVDAFTAATDGDGRPYFRYARAVRADLSSRFPTTEDQALAPLDPTALTSVLLIQLRDPQAAREKLLNRIYLVAAGLAAGLLAIAAFWFVTMRIILSPVRVLHDYAQRVSQGDTQTRSDINTGDEFEALSNMFNTMLDALKDQQDRLKAANKTLDLRLGELAESNVALYEANKVKGDFLANVSHELRTPLNSIIGFAEVLGETLEGEVTDPSKEPKKRRYAANIVTSARRLLDLINELLDLAKIEAGKMEPRIESVSLADVCEGLATLIRPQAEKRQIELRVKVEPKLPMIQTDAGKLQQIVFNFLANAVKFTPERGTVTLSAASEPTAAEAATAVRISVRDTGPGIAEEDRERIFEKFVQLDPTVTKLHGGTGLGLTISRELAQMLRGRIEVDSRPGRGATFSLVLPVAFPEDKAPLMPEAAAAG